jgi:hypothetical protein
VHAGVPEGADQPQHRSLCTTSSSNPKKADSLLDDLRETFANLDRYSIKLNPKKCSFGVPTGQLLGYLISERGIEGNPKKIQALINMQPPKTLRHFQQLIGRLAALSRFISKLGEKALPF